MVASSLSDGIRIKHLHETVCLLLGSLHPAQALQGCETPLSLHESYGFRPETENVK